MLSHRAARRHLAATLLATFAIAAAYAVYALTTAGHAAAARPDPQRQARGSTGTAALAAYPLLSPLHSPSPPLESPSPGPSSPIPLPDFMWSRRMMIINGVQDLSLAVDGAGFVVAIPHHPSTATRWVALDAWKSASGTRTLRRQGLLGSCVGTQMDPATGAERLILTACTDDYGLDWVLDFEPGTPTFRIINYKSRKAVTVGALIGGSAPVTVNVQREDAPAQWFGVDNCQACG